MMSLVLDRKAVSFQTQCEDIAVLVSFLIHSFPLFYCPTADFRLCIVLNCFTVFSLVFIFVSFFYCSYYDASYLVEAFRSRKAAQKERNILNILNFEISDRLLDMQKWIEGENSGPQQQIWYPQHPCENYGIVEVIWSHPPLQKPTNAQDSSCVSSTIRKRHF